MNCALEEPDLMAEPTSRQLVTRLRAGQFSQAEDELAEEAPVALEYNGVSHAVMMATPRDLDDFALGFSLSEGIVGSAREFYGAEVEHGAVSHFYRSSYSRIAFACIPGLSSIRRPGQSGLGSAE